jgi:hypothetical protein
VSIFALISTRWHVFVLFLGLKIGFLFSPLLLFAWWPPLLFLVRFFYIFALIKKTNCLYHGSAGRTVTAAPVFKNAPRDMELS